MSWTALNQDEIGNVAHMRGGTASVRDGFATVLVAKCGRDRQPRSRSVGSEISPWRQQHLSCFVSIPRFGDMSKLIFQRVVLKVPTHYCVFRLGGSDTLPRSKLSPAVVLCIIHAFFHEHDTDRCRQRREAVIALVVTVEMK